MLRRTLFSLATLGSLLTACYDGSPISREEVVISARDVELAGDAPVIIAVDDPATVLRFDFAEGPIDLTRVVLELPAGSLSLQEAIAGHGKVLGVDLFASAEGFVLRGEALLGLDLAPAPTSGGVTFLLPTQSAALAKVPRLDRIELDARAVPRFMVGDLGTLGTKDAASGALALVKELAPAFRLGAEHDLEVVRVAEDSLGQVHVRLQLFLHDLPVVGGEVIVHAELASGQVRALSSELAGEAPSAIDPSMEAEAALAVAAATLADPEWSIADAPELVYVLVEGKPVLAYGAPIAYESVHGPELDVVFADATTGEIIARHPKIHRALGRKIYSANNGGSLPGTLKMSEGGTSTDPVVKAAYDNAGVTWNYYKAKFGRDSYNGAGATLVSTVHYGNKYNNAFWNGSQMVYGDGDNVYFASFATSPDVVVHELTHAITENEAGLVYQNESGALNEAFSDIFAAAAQAWQAGSVSANTWKLAEDIWTPGTGGDAMRYMDNPTADGQSYDYYPERYTGADDNGGVHLNSGIANLAFKLVVAGGTHPRGKTNVSVTGLGVDKGEQIFYRALSTYLTASAKFQDARNATAQAATDLYGASAAATVHAAWDAVGVPGSPGNGGGGNGGGNGGGGGACSGTPYGGSLSGNGAVQYQPNGTYYQSTKSGAHVGCLTGPASADYDLYLLKWNGSSWSTVAKSEGETSSESINYNGSAGYYTWQVVSYAGSGSYSLALQKP